MALSASLLGGCGGKADVSFVGEPEPESECGNGLVEDDEECDDENTEKGDGCDARCRAEPGYVCTVDDDARSACVMSCNNGTIDEGETCEDGNLDDDDGCSANCQIEGTCEAPWALEFSEDGTVKLNASNRGGGRNVPAASCGGADAGGGSDRIYSFTLEERRDVTIKLSADFNSVLRLVSEDPCDLEEELACSNEDGTETETITRKDLPPGTYYLIVDAATNSAQGDFTLSIATTCPQSNLVISRVDTYARTGVVLMNRSDECTVSLNGMWLGIGYSGSEYSKKLPNRSLDAGETVGVVYEYYARDDEIPIDASMYYGFGSALLCEGECDFSSGENVKDGVVWGTDELPSGLTFEPAPLATINSYDIDYFTDYVRVDFDGEWPDFKASDWGLMLEIDPNVYPNPATISSSWFKANGTVGGLSVVTAADEDMGSVIQVSSGAASNYYGYYATTPTMRPRYIAYKFLTPSTSTAWTASFNLGTIADPGLISVQHVYLDQAYFYSPAGNVVVPIEYDVWNSVELRDIDWDARTYDVWLNGEQVADDLPQSPIPGPGTLAEVQTVQIGNWSANHTCQFAEIVMY